MSGKSYSNKANSEQVDGANPNWAQAADNAAKKAEEEIEKIKRDAHNEVKNTQQKNNPGTK